MIAENFCKSWKKMYLKIFSFVICAYAYTLGYIVNCEISEENNIFDSCFGNIERQIPWNSIRFKIIVWDPSKFNIIFIHLIISYVFDLRAYEIVHYEILFLLYKRNIPF